MLEAHIYHTSSHLLSNPFDNLCFSVVDADQIEHKAWTATGKRKDTSGNAIPTIFLYIEQPTNGKESNYKLIEIPSSNISNITQLKSIALNSVSKLSMPTK